MIRRSPCERYIKYLLVHPDKYSTDAVVDLLRLQQLDFVGHRYIDRLRAGLKIPSVFRPRDLTHLTSYNFLLRHRLYRLFHPDKIMRDALSILHDAKAKETAEAMIITDDAPAMIAHRMACLGFEGTVEVIDRYKFFFFDTSLLDNTELRALMRLRVEYVGDNDDVEDGQVRIALKASSYGDPRRLSSDFASKPAARILNQVRMGFSVKQIDVARLLSAARVASIAQMLEALKSTSKQAPAMSRDLALTAKLIGEMMENLGNPDVGLQKELHLMQLKTEQAGVPHIAELSAGRHTVDVQPVITVEADEDE